MGAGQSSILPELLGDQFGTRLHCRLRRPYLTPPHTRFHALCTTLWTSLTPGGQALHCDDRRTESVPGRGSMSWCLLSRPKPVRHSVPVTATGTLAVAAPISRNAKDFAEHRQMKLLPESLLAIVAHLLDCRTAPLRHYPPSSVVCHALSRRTPSPSASASRPDSSASCPITSAARSWNVERFRISWPSTCQIHLATVGWQPVFRKSSASTDPGGL